MQGAVIGSYRLVEKIGEGGMGAVWVAEHTLLGRRAAMKLLLPAYSTNPAIVQRFFNEARAVAAIADPGIVQVFDYGVHTDGAAYIVMELLAGETLAARLARVGRLSALDAVRLVRQVAISLAAAHGKGVIHRDLKPENLFVVGDPAVTGGERPKVLDFGIAKLAGEDSKHKTRTGMMLGTPMFMSPEQCRGARTIDHRTDIYSLGAVLFCFVVGRPPFEGEGSGDVIIAHVRDQPPVPSALAPVPPALDAVILRCLEKDPARRFQTMEELAAALGQIDAAIREGLVPPAGAAAVSMAGMAGMAGRAAMPGAVGMPGPLPTPMPGALPTPMPGALPTPMPGALPTPMPGALPTPFGSGMGLPVPVGMPASPSKVTTVSSAIGEARPAQTAAGRPGRRWRGAVISAAVAGALVVAGAVVLGGGGGGGGGGGTGEPGAAAAGAPAGEGDAAGSAAAPDSTATVPPRPGANTERGATGGAATGAGGAGGGAAEDSSGASGASSSGATGGTAAAGSSGAGGAIGGGAAAAANGAGGAAATASGSSAAGSGSSAAGSGSSAAGSGSSTAATGGGSAAGRGSSTASPGSAANASGDGSTAQSPSTSTPAVREPAGPPRRGPGRRTEPRGTTPRIDRGD